MVQWYQVMLENCKDVQKAQGRRQHEPEENNHCTGRKRNACRSAYRMRGRAGIGKSEEPVNLTIWTYYNGEQLDAFNALVDSFNESVGKEKNIIVESSSLGSVNDLESNVMDAAEEKVGAADMPNIFSAYADTAYKLDQAGQVVDLSDYLTDEEKVNI